MSEAAEALLVPEVVTPETISRLSDQLLLIGDALEAVIPSRMIGSDDQPPLVSTAWEYLDLLRRTTATARSWLVANEKVICGEHPALAALPAFLLGASDPDRELPGSVDAWPCSHHPHREATLFVEEVRRAAELLPVWRAYEAELEDRGFVDFATVLADAVRVLQNDSDTRARAQVKRVIVDEGQDLSPLMLTFARHLTTEECIIYGDTCQTINEWAGANRYGIAELTEQGANVLQLDVDYRKAPTIEHFCDNFRATIDEESRLDLESYRAATLPSGEEPPWPDKPVRWVSQGGDWASTYRAVIDAVERDSVPGWTVPDDASIATLARRTTTVTQCREIATSDTLSDDTTASIPALIQLARFLSQVIGLGDETEYVGQYDSNDDSADESLVETLPRLIATWYDIPHSVAVETLERDDCNPWIALVRLVEYGQDEMLEQPAYRIALVNAYHNLLDLAAHARRDTLGHFFHVLQDQFSLRRRPEINGAELDALETAIAGIQTPEGYPAPRPDRGALNQLEARWRTVRDDGEAGAHKISTIHKFKGDEADVVIVPNLTAGPWGVLDTSSRPFDRRRAVNSLTRVRHQLAFDKSPVAESLVQRKRHNERRVAYTAFSRARDLLIMLGEPSSQPRRLSSEVNPDDCLPRDVNRVENAHSLDIWTELQASLPGEGATCWSREILGLHRDGGGD